MRVLIIGSGGREHALIWKLKQSPSVRALFALPGSDAIAAIATRLDGSIHDHNAILDHCRQQQIDLVVVGPELPLIAGLADALAKAGIACFGPIAAAARLEGSKGFTKALCREAGIPTAPWRRFDDLNAARAHIATTSGRLALKLDGLAAGKGVILAFSRDQAHAAVDDLATLAAQQGIAADLIVETLLEGLEISFFVLCDGHTVLPFGAARDYKCRNDGNTGPNTGGMGAYTPTQLWTPEREKNIMQRIIKPTLAALHQRNIDYRGVLYAGLMLTAEGPFLLEYNVRFGDPECQAMMMRFNGDLAMLLYATATGGLDKIDSTALFHDDAAVAIVLAHHDYPGTIKSPSLLPIDIDDMGRNSNGIVYFHAGTQHSNGHYKTCGGRVLAITARAPTLNEARQRAYDAIAEHNWNGIHWRRDIAAHDPEQSASMKDPRHAPCADLQTRQNGDTIRTTSNPSLAVTL